MIIRAKFIFITKEKNTRIKRQNIYLIHFSSELRQHLRLVYISAQNGCGQTIRGLRRRPNRFANRVRKLEQWRKSEARSEFSTLPPFLPARVRTTSDFQKKKKSFSRRYIYFFVLFDNYLYVKGTRDQSIRIVAIINSVENRSRIGTLI